MNKFYWKKYDTVLKNKVTGDGHSSALIAALLASIFPRNKIVFTVEIHLQCFNN